MRKIRTVLAAALLTLPIAALSAHGLAAAPGGTQVRSAQGQTCCWVYWNGFWVCNPC